MTNRKKLEISPIRLLPKIMSLWSISWHDSRLVFWWKPVLLSAAFLFSACSSLSLWLDEPLPTLEATAFVPTIPPVYQATSVQDISAPVIATANPTTNENTSSNEATIMPDVSVTNTPELELATYTVLPEDNLNNIALNYNVTVQELLQANNLREGDLIHPDDVLLIPPPSQPSGPKPLPPYTVQQGDTLSSIASQYGISVALLMHVNGLGSEQIIAGQILKMPIGAYEVQFGDTLSVIAWDWYENRISLEELAQANASRISLENLDEVQAGAILEIPLSSGVIPDCRPVPERLGVITYTIQSGEGLACLALKFQLQMATIRNANPQMDLDTDDVTNTQIVILPADGALYSVSVEDMEYSTLLSDIAGWYDVSETSILDWNGEQVVTISAPGTNLFIRGADLQAGNFNAAAWAAYKAINPAPPVPPPFVSNAPPEQQMQATLPPSQGSNYTPPSGSPPPGAVRPSNYLWVGEISVFDTGYCNLLAGSGWSGSLAWPISSRTIRENRHFRPGHAAIDIDAPTGTPVFAAETGVVVWAGFSAWGGGNIIVLAHGNTWQTYYVHLSEVLVSCGQTVSKGSTIGLSGQSGGVSWPHLHFEVQFGGFNYDPLGWLPPP